jgi:nicotinamidase-related amidase
MVFFRSRLLNLNPAMTKIKKKNGNGPNPQRPAGANSNISGEAKSRSPVALLLIDLINDMEFEEGRQLFEHAFPAARKIVRLKERAEAAGVPVIYVNDNFGHWRSDLNVQIRHCIEDKVRGEPIARMLKPCRSDYFVLKPKSSAFFDTTLQTLLQYLEIKTLILTGVAADVCILYTAHDAHLRDYDIIVPRDCVASNSRKETAAALRNMEKSTHACVCDSSEIDFQRLAARKPLSTAA